MTKKQVDQSVKESHDVADAKDKLTRALSRLDDGGTTRAAMQLSSIIGRLESWQNSHR